MAGAPVADERRRLDGYEEQELAGVGRLEIEGRRFCTATLIAPREVVSAAHCLYGPRSGLRVPVSSLRFAIVSRNGGVTARIGVARAAVFPGYRFERQADLADVGRDLALLELKEPVELPPLRVGSLPQGQVLALVSYSHSQPETPAIQDACRVIADLDGLLALDCAITAGASGGPVLATEPSGRRLVAVVSAIGRDFFRADLSLAVALAPRLAELRQALAEEPASAPEQD